MIYFVIMFVLALAVLLLSANVFTAAAEEIGRWLKFSPFVVGIFIVGIGTSLPELISGILSVRKQVSEIVPGNIIGANISNLLLVTGLAVALHRKSIHLGSNYIYIDLHFLIGAVASFYLIAYDGKIFWTEAAFGLVLFVVYSFYLLKGQGEPPAGVPAPDRGFPLKSWLLLVVVSCPSNIVSKNK